MKRWAAALALLILLPVLLGLPTPRTHAQGNTTYTVQPGDTLYSIARKFGVSVDDLIRVNNIADPSSLTPGQTLIIPVAASPAATQASASGTQSVQPATQPAAQTAPTATSLPVTPAPPATYTVVAGDDLNKIATRFHTTVGMIMRLNGMTDANHLAIGQVLKMPGGQAPTTSATQEAVPASTAKNVPFALGITAFLNLDNAARVADLVGDLGVPWVRIPVSWRDLEATKGTYTFTPLDAEIAPLGDFNVKIMFTVSDAPDWARQSKDENGPPADFNDFGVFMKAMADHYKGVVQAYEIWSEPNLRREWNGRPLSAASYVDLLRHAYNAIKQIDPSIVVVSAGLAPTGVDDGTNALADRSFLAAAYSAGLASVSDAVGVHAEGWVNPPDNHCCTPLPGVSGWNSDRTFFFQDTLLDYHKIIAQAGDSTKLMWVTQFGWGTSMGITDKPAAMIPGMDFVAFNTDAQQAQYIPRAFAIGQSLEYVGPMFVYNLNACDFYKPSTPSYGACFYALVTPKGDKRPVYDAIKSAKK